MVFAWTQTLHDRFFRFRCSKVNTSVNYVDANDCRKENLFKDFIYGRKERRVPAWFIPPEGYVLVGAYSIRWRNTATVTANFVVFNASIAF